MKITLYLLISFYIIVGDNAARILTVFPVPCISHQSVFKRFLYELISQGHEVTSISAHTEEDDMKNLKDINIYNDTYPIWRREVADKLGKANYYNVRMRRGLVTQKYVLDNILQNTEVKKLINNRESFDLLIIEAWIMPLVAFSHIFKAPVIKMQATMIIFDGYHIIGSAVHPVLYPLGLQQHINNQTVLDDIWTCYIDFFIHNTYSNSADEANHMLRKHFEDIPLLSELNNNVDMLLINDIAIWDMNRAVPLSVVYAGSLHLKPAKDLPEDLKNYLDSSEHGVIYVSFGTNVPSSALPLAAVQVMVRVLSSMPYDVLWKWDLEEMPGREANIKISRWLPQADLLRHPNVKLFVTHCGMQSTYEAIDAGVPVVAIPLAVDQWFNAENCVRHKLGVKVDLETITDEEFKDALQTVIGDERYRLNMTRFGALIRDTPQTPLQRAVWWTEHVLRHGAQHVRAPAHNMPWTEYLEIELLAIVILCVLLFIFTVATAVYLVYCFVRLCLGSPPTRSRAAWWSTL